jgi:hypothetical protein
MFARGTLAARMALQHRTAGIDSPYADADRNILLKRFIDMPRWRRSDVKLVSRKKARHRPS